MATKQQTTQAWRIVSDPEAHEKQWLSACSALGPKAVHPSQSFKLPTSVQTTGSAFLSYFTAMGHVLSIYILVLSMLVFFGMPINLIYQHWCGWLFPCMTVPAAAGVNIGLLDRGNSRVSQGVWTIPVFLLFGLFCFMRPQNIAECACWALPALLAGYVSYWAGRHLRSSLTKFSSACKLGASSLACASVYAVLAWWAIWMGYNHPYRHHDPTWGTSDAMIGTTMIVLPLFVSATVGGVVCGSRRLKTGIGAGLLLNLPLIAGCALTSIGAGIMGATSLGIGVSGFQIMTAFAASMGAAAATSVIGGMAGCGIVRLKAEQAKKLEAKTIAASVAS